MKPKPPQLQLLPAFEAVARQLSFKAAAEELNVTPSAISQQIKTLESQLELQLLVRQTRSVRLTAVGQQYFELVSELLNNFRDGHADIYRAQASPSIRLSTVTQVAYDVLIPALPSFHKVMPDVDLRIETSELLVDLVQDHIDAAIRVGSGHWPGLTSWKLCDISVLAVASHSLLANQPEGTEVAFEDYQLIHSRSHVNDWQRAAERLELDISRNKQLFFETSLAAMNAAENGLGIAFALLPFSQSRLDRGNLKTLLDQEIPLEDACYMVIPSARENDPKLLALYDWLKPLFQTSAQTLPQTPNRS